MAPMNLCSVVAGDDAIKQTRVKIHEEEGRRRGKKKEEKKEEEEEE